MIRVNIFNTVELIGVKREKDVFNAVLEYNYKVIDNMEQKNLSKVTNKREWRKYVFTLVTHKNKIEMRYYYYCYYYKSDKKLILRWLFRSTCLYLLLQENKVPTHVHGPPFLRIRFIQRAFFFSLRCLNSNIYNWRTIRNGLDSNPKFLF